MTTVAFYRDRFVDIQEDVLPIEDRGHQFGDGIYEVIRVYSGVPFTLEEHLERLERSAEAIRMPLPYSIDDIRSRALQAYEDTGLEEAEIYLQITRGAWTRQHHFPEPAAPVLSMVAGPAREVSSTLRASGVKVITTEDIRWKRCWIKSLNLLPNVMAKQEAKDHGAHEAVFVDGDAVTEGSSTNIFRVKDGVLETHPATERILHGITRRMVLQAAEQIGLPCRELPFTKQELLESDEAFLTSTTMEVLGIDQIDETALPAARPITEKLFQQFQQIKHETRTQEGSTE
ncbi:D-amino-acid transaminase [Alkalicoccus chagannorensis]|uniref:D-amino-acid transaminase n=1 Tax=Alkalicoccus chagannorensis TaxID=427072 RepID=UPI0003F732DD|nr:D-amino-acid transaminase [Alkalicoccus chagannorensis]